MRNKPSRPISINISFVFCAFVLVLQACTPQQTQEAEETILLTPTAELTENGYFKKHFEVTEVIPIETNDDFLVSDIKKVIRHQDKIILLSGKSNTVFVMNADDGRIETYINKIGKGPGEWRSILDIAYDEETEQLLIYNDYSKLLTFDLHGQFISESSVDDLYENIQVLNGQVLFYNKLDGYSSYPYAINILNKDDSTWKSVGNDKKLEFPIRNGRQMVKSKQLWFTAPLDFKLYKYQNEQITAPYELNIPDANLLDEGLIEKATSNPMEFFKEVSSNSLTYSINSVRETSDYIVFSSNQERLYIINKKENKVYRDEYLDETALRMNLKYFPHDGDDDKIMFILPARSYASYAQANPEIADGSLEIDEFDNPILIFYKQK